MMSGEETSHEEMNHEEGRGGGACDEAMSDADVDEVAMSDDEEEVCDEEEDADVNRIHAEDLAGLSREELEARIMEERKGRLEAEQRRLEAEQLRQEAEQRSEQLRLGTYYSTIDQLWTGEGRHVGRGDSHLFDILKRTRAPSFVSPNGANYYDETISKANDPALRPAEVGRSTAAGSSPEMRLDIWPRDIFGAENTEGAQLAHLVPASRDNSALFFDVAVGALALPVQRYRHHREWETIQKAIHGAIAAATETPTTEAPTTSPRRAPHRRPHTGIKHSVTNLIRLAGQATYFDQYPCVLIVPVLTLRQVKCWNGERYSAIVMVGTFKPPRRPLIHLASICSFINMQEKGPTANPEQVEVARVLLSHFVLGMAYSLIYRSSTWVTELSFEQGRRLDECLRVFVENATGGGVVIPKPRSGPRTGSPPLRPRLVSFRGAAEAANDNDHLAPDPYLLAVKAAINWSARHRQPLLAAAEPVDEEEINELYVLAMEQYLNYYDESVRPPNCPKALAQQLNQSESFQGEDSRGFDQRRRISLEDSPSS